MPAAILVGIDGSDTVHHVEATSPSGDQVLRLQISNDLSGFQQLEAALTAAFGDLPRHYALENPASLLGCYLLHQQQAVYAVNPRAVARLREALNPSGKKDDPADAHACLVLLRERHAECAPILPNSPAGALVAGLVQQRVDVVEEKTRVTNQLTAVLKRFYPRALELFPHLEQPLTLDFLTAFPTPSELQQASLESWQALFAGKRYPHPARIGTTLWERAQAPQVPVSPPEAALGRAAVRRLVRLLRVLRDELQQLEQQIETHFAELPEARIFTSAPGSGAVLGPALFAIFGDNPAAWSDWRAVAQACGSVPITRRSGSSRSVQMREHCDKRARRTLHLFAGCSRRGCAWAREFYAAQRRQGKKHATALRNLGTRWLRILFRMWKEGTVYDEATYLRDRTARRAPRAAAPAAVAPSS